MLGGAIAEELIARGERVRALVRSGKRVARLRQLGIEMEVGDLLDQRALRRVLRDAHAVITTAQGNPLSRKQPLRRVDGAGTQRLISMARELHVPKFVFISALKADQGAGRVPQLAYKLAAERALQASGLGYTIIRPSSFQETFADGFAPFKRWIERANLGVTIGSGRGAHSFVAIADVARAAVLALSAPEARNQIVPIGGPEDLNYPEAYRRIGQVLGRPITIAPIPRPLVKIGGVLAMPVLPELNGFFEFFNFFDQAGYTCVTPDWLVRALGQRRSFYEAMRAIYLPAAGGERQPAPDTSGR